MTDLRKQAEALIEASGDPQGKRTFGEWVAYAHLCRGSAPYVARALLKALTVVEAARKAYGATVDEDGGEGDGIYLAWEPLLAFREKLDAFDAEVGK